MVLRFILIYIRAKCSNTLVYNHVRMNSSVKAAVVIVAVLAVVAGAFYEVGVKQNLGDKLVAPQNSGNLNVYVYDAPAAGNVTAVYMTFSVVSLYVNFQGWTNYTLAKHTIEISNLTSTNALLLQNLSLAPQQYSAVGLYVTNVSATINGTDKPFKLASTDIFVSHQFAVITNKTTDVSIQFDLISDLNLDSLVFTPNVGTSFATGQKGQNNATANFYVYDAPPSSYNVSAVYMSFSNISLHGEQTGWVNYSVTNGSINIYNRSEANASLLNSVNISAQNYTMIRLYLQNVTATVNGVNETFKIASPYAMINHPFNVSANGTINVKIQFDLLKDLNVNGQVFTPLIGTTVST